MNNFISIKKNVETEIIKNNKFQKIIISVLSIIVVLFILAFILLA